jgi:hypothetical protein
MVIRESDSEKGRHFLILTNYTQEELSQVREKWAHRLGVQLMIGPDNFTMIWFTDEADKNWFVLEWQ